MWWWRSEDWTHWWPLCGPAVDPDPGPSFNAVARCERRKDDNMEHKRLRIEDI